MSETRPCDVQGIRVHIIDVCLPDYFGAHCAAPEIVAVPLWKDMTYKEIYDEINTYFNSTEGWYSQVAGSAGMLEEGIKEMYEMVGVTDENIAEFTRDFSDTAVDGETVYLYIGLYPITEEGVQHD